MLRLQSSSAGSEEAKELLKAATVNPTDNLGLPFGPLKDGGEARFTVLSVDRNLKRCEDPYVGILNRATVANVEKVYGPRKFS